MYLTSLQLHDEMASTNQLNMLDGLSRTDANRAKSSQTISTREADLALDRARRLARDTPADVLRVASTLDDFFDGEDEDPTGALTPVNIRTGWSIAS